MASNRARAVARAFVWSACGLILLMGQAYAASADFKNKTMTIVVGFGAGGGYDADARLIGKYMGAHLPGNPTFVVRDMPGAGGLVAMNYIYNNAPRDGTTMGVVAPSVAVAQLMRSEKNIKYDVREVTWIGRFTSNDGTLLAWSKGKYHSIKDAQEHEVVVAGTGPTSDSVIFPRLLNEFIHTKYKIVSGYSGTNAAQLSLERGEVDAISKNWSNVKVENAEWLAQKKIIVTLQYGAERDPLLANVPTAVELAKDEDQHKILAFFASSGSIGVSLVASPKMSSEVTKALRDAFTQTMRDPRLVGEAKKLEMDLDPLSAAGLKEICDADFAIPDSLVERAKDILDSQ